MSEPFLTPETVLSAQRSMRQAIAKLESWRKSFVSTPFLVEAASVLKYDRAVAAERDKGLAFVKDYAADVVARVPWLPDHAFDPLGVLDDSCWECPFVKAAHPDQ